MIEKEKANREVETMKKKRRCSWCVVILALFMVISFVGEGLSAEKFPTKPITLVIGFNPGDTDNILRPFMEKLPEYLGQPVSYVYKPGAAGSIGAKYVAGSKPDGYTWIGTSQSSLAIVPLNQDTGYTWDSFEQISYVSESTYVIAVRSDSRWKTLKDLVEDAKQNPGKISFTTSGTFGLPHMCGELFFQEAGIKLNHIPSAGSNPGVMACLGGHIDVLSLPVTSLIAHVRAGTIRVLASYAPQRNKVVQDVPTCLELGYKTNIEVLVGISAAKGTPKEIINTIDTAVQKVIQNHKPFLVERLDKMGQNLNYGGPEKYAAMLKRNNDMFKPLVASLKK
jgi:tripartite-type tricarboxylate transporter receptor subunit TctC